MTAEQSSQPLSRLSREQIDLLKRTVCKGATDDELEMFIGVAQRKGLDPFAGQIHAVKRYDKSLGREVMRYQTAIDGFRLIAQRTGERDGEGEPLWCGDDAAWQPVWTPATPPIACKFTVYRKGHTRPYYGFAYFQMFAQRRKGGDLTQMWEKGAAYMLAKCSEAVALRKAFPQELSGLYTHEEMQQAGEPLRENVHDLEKQIDAARTTAELQAIGEDFARLSEPAREYLRSPWKLRFEQLIDAEMDAKADAAKGAA